MCRCRTSDALEVGSLFEKHVKEMHVKAYPLKVHGLLVADVFVDKRMILLARSSGRWLFHVQQVVANGWNRRAL